MGHERAEVIYLPSLKQRPKKGTLLFLTLLGTRQNFQSPQLLPSTSKDLSRGVKKRRPVRCSEGLKGQVLKRRRDLVSPKPLVLLQYSRAVFQGRDQADQAAHRGKPENSALRKAL